MKHSILFVCLGNICRSPAGEGLFRTLVADRGVDDLVRVDSAGTIAHHTGNPPDPRMRGAAAQRGYELVGEARQIQPDDFEHFDLVIAMDGDNLSDILELPGHRDGQVRLLSDFLPASSPTDIPDPYYGGDDGFEIVLDMIEEACPPLLDHLLGLDPRA